MLPSTVLVPVTKYTVRGKRFFTQKPRSREAAKEKKGRPGRMPGWQAPQRRALGHTRLRAWPIDNPHNPGMCMWGCS